MTLSAWSTASAPATPERNYSRILHHIYQHRIDTRANIAKSLHLTPAAVSKITAKLLANGILTETGNQQGSKNRRSIGLCIHADKFHILGIAINAHRAELATFNLYGHRTKQAELIVDQTTSQHPHETLIQSALTYVQSDPLIIAVGISQPSATQHAYETTANPIFSHDIIDELREHITLPIFLTRAARAGALSQYLFTKTDNKTNLLAYCLIDEHITMGVIDNNYVLNTANNVSARIGHVSINVNGIACPCGNYGCLEQYCSTVAMHRQAIEHGILPQTNNAITHRQACRMIFDKARNGDKESQMLATQIGTYIGYGCVSILNILNPDKLIIGGVIAQGGGETLLSTIRSVADQRTPNWIHASTVITPAQPTFDTPTCAAAAAAIARMLENPNQYFTNQQNHDTFDALDSRKTINRSILATMAHSSAG